MALPAVVDAGPVGAAENAGIGRPAGRPVASGWEKRCSLILMWTCFITRSRFWTDYADAVEMEGGAVRPVEYKSGVRHGAAADLQLCAQALCLEEMLDVEVPHGYVWYGGPRRRVQVDFTPALRHDVREVIRQIRMQILTAALPEAPNDQRCAECQLLHHCLPELTSAPRKVNRYMTSTVFGCAT